ncbi:glycosyltransferase family 4 protein [Parapedobacter koreensis]|uniref:Glycosyltransferase involved in cell wall bisynthesis n=1 Tax=Parapedobacter koreensis TaxID=332977 RepID=A0A1H7LPC4_9SPHI|nr:glycosyltransferase family 1 protein [Parapedobacter koreensis]SEL00771.1 Glycosyltransferase involved in cell wall bisynthesis [Parapedobacter koreensis]
MTKVAFFAEMLIEEFDGASRTMFQLIRRIDPAEFDYLFVSGRSGQMDSPHRTFSVPSVRVPINADYSMSIPHLLKHKLERSLDAFNPDVIHIATPSLLGFFALKYAQKRNIPVITIYHTHFIAYLAYYLSKLPFLINVMENITRSSMRRFYNGCDHVYVPSQRIIDELSDIGIDRTKLQLWQRGIDLHTFCAEKRDLPYMQRLVGNDKPTILFVSRLVWEKNLATLMQVYQLFKETGWEGNFLVVGDGAARRELQMQMKDAQFLGQLDHDQLATLYASSDVFVFTSVSETYGNVVVEAMASGLPCVIADGGGSADLIAHGYTGFKCAPYDPQAYFNYIKLLLDNPLIREDITQRALHHARSLDWNQLADSYFRDIHALKNANRRFEHTVL